MTTREEVVFGAADLRAALDRMRQATEAVDQAKRDLLTKIRHGLKAPLEQILDPLESLLAGVRGPLDEAVRRELQGVYRGAVRLKVLVELLSPDGADTDGMSARPEPVETEEPIESPPDDTQPSASIGRLVPPSHVRPSTEPRAHGLNRGPAARERSARPPVAAAPRGAGGTGEVERATRLHARPSVSRPRILFAEDNEDLRDYIEMLLGEEMDIVAVGDGHAALIAARRSTPDLVLTDVTMPIMDGLTLVSELKHDAALRHVPVILLTARSGREAAAQCLDHGADDYIPKPFDDTELKARIRAALRRQRAYPCSEAPPPRPLSRAGAAG